MLPLAGKKSRSVENQQMTAKLKNSVFSEIHTIHAFGTAITVDMQYCSMYFSLVPMFCMIVLQDALKKLLCPQESESIIIL